MLSSPRSWLWQQGWALPHLRPKHVYLQVPWRPPAWAGPPNPVTAEQFQGKNVTTLKTAGTIFNTGRQCLPRDIKVPAEGERSYKFSHGSSAMEKKLSGELQLPQLPLIGVCWMLHILSIG